MLKKRKLPRSGNKLVDWHFRQVIYYLENKVSAILIVNKSLKDPRNKKILLRGYIDVNHKGRAIIFVSGIKNTHADREMMGKTLTHEVAHGFLEDYVHEKSILTLEDLLWNAFTKDQKNIIKSFLPKHKVKRAPEAA